MTVFALLRLGFEDSQDIADMQGLSIRFLKNGTTEVGAFQVGAENAAVQIVDNYPVEVSFNSQQDYGFVLDQLAANASVNLSMVDQDISYGIFDLKGSGAAIRSLRSACDSDASQGTSYEAPEGHRLLWWRSEKTRNRTRNFGQPRRRVGRASNG